MASDTALTPSPESEHFGINALIAAVEAMTAARQSGPALELYDLWLRHHPADPMRYVACFNYGALSLQTGCLQRAATAFAEAIRLEPAFLPAHINAGLAFERLGHPDRAVAQWLHVADLLVRSDSDANEHKTTALKHIARIFKTSGDIASAEEALRRCLLIDPHQRDTVQHWICARQMQCKWPVISPVGKLVRSHLIAASSPLALAILTDDPMFQLANAWRSSELDVARSPGPYTVGRWIADGLARTRPLRIGYVSPDLREHAIGFLTAEVFELHDRAKVEVFAYYSGRVGPDAMQRRIRQAADHWRDIVGWTAKQVARQIVSDEIDIVIDLGGHTGDAPTAAFALRPAPVIVNWLGYPGSMGTSHHQYIIADEKIIPAAYEKFYSERVMRLPCYQPTDRKRIVADPAPTRQDVGLPEDAVVFCCFNGTQKITPSMFRCWMEVLARVPQAVLWLLSCDAATDERLRQQAASHGIAPVRLVFAERKLNAEHLARYPLADLFLDTAPYGAHTTASDALWMGVPVVTMTGHSFASRVCASLVSAAGLPEMVCDGPAAYVERTVEMGAQPGRLQGVRERLQASRDDCILFDMNLLITRLETLYEQMWDEYRSGRIPEPDLTNLALYNEIGGNLDNESAGCCDLAVYEARYAIALTYRDRVSQVPRDRRLWAAQNKL